MEAAREGMRLGEAEIMALERPAWLRRVLRPILLLLQWLNPRWLALRAMWFPTLDQTILTFGKSQGVLYEYFSKRF